MNLQPHQTMLLEALGCAVAGNTVSWEQVEHESWNRLYQLAYDHKLVPLVYQAAGRCPAAQQWQGKGQWRIHAMTQLARQTNMSQEALAVYDALTAAGLQVLVVKGMICRTVYSNGDLRISGDEDFYVSGEEFDACCEKLVELGLQPVDDTRESWCTTSGTLYLELHRELFPQQELEQMFTGALVGEYQIQPGRTVKSFDPHWHLLYLILHAYKHLLYSGFGLRQICDICLWAERYETQIDWKRLQTQCEVVHGAVFAATVFAIGQKEFGIGRQWFDCGEKDHLPLLKDILDAGIYGSADSSRLHSATLLRQQQKSEKGSVLRSVLPPRAYMEQRYPVLKTKPHLMPLMWVDRLAKYGKKMLQEKRNPGEAMAVAKQRRELLEYYEIL